MQHIILDESKSDVTSQFGEDGIIDRILGLLPQTSRTCVEFGAWDGKLFSNTYNLINAKGFAAVLIEGDPEKHRQLADFYKERPDVQAICAMVDWQKSNLDILLQQTTLPLDFDVLSIDIDGNDYHVWKACTRYRPKVVCIEFNPTIATGVEYVQPAEMSTAVGASISSLVRLGTEKGYKLVAATLSNAIFVHEDHVAHVPVASHDPAVLRTDCSWVSNIFFSYDGQTLVTGNPLTPWHGFPVSGLIRKLPSFLKGFPPTMPVWKRKLLGLYKKFL